MRRFAFLVLGLVCFPVLALTNVDLYQTEIVLEQSVDNADAKARVSGMKEIIVRASGDFDVTSNPVIQKALKQNSQYLSQISHGQREGLQTLKMGFSAPHIRSLLSQAQVPIWPAARANILVWLVEEVQYDRSVSWEHSDSKILTEMKAEAFKRGLPLTVPVGDFDDITGVSASDLWGGFARPVGEASQRYPVDAALVVRSDGNMLRWTLYDQKPATIGVTRQAPLSGSSAGKNASSKMINQISDYYAKKSSVIVASEPSETVKVRFKALKNAVDFFTLENNLKKLSSVASLDILKIQRDQVTFTVHLLTSQAKFEQEVGRMDKVIPLSNIIDSIPANHQEKEKELSGEVANSDLSYADGTYVDLIPAEQILMFEWRGTPIAVTTEEQQTPESVLEFDEIENEY
ncbi:DUF2066 domain-containing protein [Vibrio hepatarius]|uniref:DUF2066 domain-containing protein n=1 Tax=Vibrio hepatarius TaxID=171383 RepID=UPI001C091037|nr:DUF2066 domain-containing protein [Vibrio hepatarius]MBU2898715.1 DUF2066 domain-containing protein [Vibrio hepatarius]